MSELSLTERAAAIATVRLVVEQANRSVRKHRAVGAAETAYRKACVRKFTAEGRAVQSALRPWRGALDTHAEVVASEALDPGPLLVVEQVDADDFTDAIVGAVGAGSAQLAGSLQARMPTLMAAGAASAQADTGPPRRARVGLS